MKSSNKKEENTATLLAATVYKFVPGFYMPVLTYCSANKEL
jgi:hypothetical protein